MQGRTIRLNMEVLEAREVPSVAPPRPVLAPPPRPVIAAPVFHLPTPLPPHLTAPIAPRISPPASHARTPQPTQSALSGTSTGSYICTLRFGNTNSGFHLHGMANINGMGQVYLFADLTAVGYASGRGASGEIELSNLKGSVTLKLTGPIQPKLSPLPSGFQYQIVSATGAYRRMKGTGHVQVTRTPDRVPISDGLMFFETGSYRMVIS